jgi:hypothetical protein
MMTNTLVPDRLPVLVRNLLDSVRDEERLIDALCVAVLRSDWSEAAVKATALAKVRGLPSGASGKAETCSR